MIGVVMVHSLQGRFKDLDYVLVGHTIQACVRLVT